MSRLHVFIGFVSVFSVVHFAGHIYLWRRLVRDTLLPKPWRSVATAALVLMSLAMPTALIVSRMVVRDTLGPIPLVGWAWMGVVFYLLLLVASADLGGAAIRRWQARKQPAPEPREERSLRSDHALDLDRRAFFSRSVAGASTASAGVFGIVGVRSAFGEFYTPEVPVSLSRLPTALDGFKICVLSDVHIGPTLDGAWLQEVVARTNALKPDLVAITGDLVDGSVAMIGQDVAALSGLKSRAGTFFSTGNHEFYSGAPEWIAFLQSLGIRVLENERVVIGDQHPGGATFDLAGVHDHRGGRFGPAYAPDLQAALAGRDAERELVLMAHQPVQIHAAEGQGVGVQISGHTHGGQMFPFGALTALVQPYIKGLHQHDADTQIYVTNGTGYWGPPMRIGAPPEITQLILTAG